MAKEFEDYAVEHYLPAVDAREPDRSILLAGLRFIETRRIAGHESRLREILATRYPGKIGREIEAASLDAILATSEDAVATAEFLALVAVTDAPAAKACEQALKELGPAAHAALLTKLTEPHPGFRLRKLARLLSRLSKVASPRPIPFWGEAGKEQRAEAVTDWESDIRRAGKL